MGILIRDLSDTKGRGLINCKPEVKAEIGLVTHNLMSAFKVYFKRLLPRIGVPASRSGYTPISHAESVETLE